MEKFWDYSFLNNSIRDWTIALGIILISWLAILILKTVVLKRIKKVVARTTTTIDDFLISVIEASIVPLLFVLAFYFGLQYLVFPGRVTKVLHIAVMVVITFYLLRSVTSFMGYLFREALARQEKNEMRERQSKGILFIVQAVIWLGGFIFLIDNLGYDITTLVAGLGIGGIAVALAAQTILGDLFSYFVIFFDKPFEIGDFIVVDDKMGTIESIGVKTTRLRALSGEQLICSNTFLTNSRVHNFRRLQERRAIFTFGVAYQTPVELLERIPEMIKDIINSIPETRFDRAHWKNFGDSSLNFEVIYFVMKPEMALFMDIQQQVNLKLYRVFQQHNIEFAFPSRTIYLHNVDTAGLHNASPSR